MSPMLPRVIRVAVLVPAIASRPPLPWLLRGLTPSDQTPTPHHPPPPPRTTQSRSPSPSVQCHTWHIAVAPRLECHPGNDRLPSPARCIRHTPRCFHACPGMRRRTSAPPHPCQSSPYTRTTSQTPRRVRPLLWQSGSRSPVTRTPRCQPHRSPSGRKCPTPQHAG